MQNYHIEVGKRLREIRMIFNEGTRLSSEQFAYLLDETGDRIRNYEIGRATVPIRLMHSLHQRGININYLVSGEGEMFLDNEAGRKFKSIIEEKSNNPTIYKASAGRIKK